MAYYPEMQRRMRKEIENNIGDRMPVQDDKNNCHFINAFISECLRHRIVAPTSVPRRALCDVEIGKQFACSHFHINIYSSLRWI